MAGPPRVRALSSYLDPISERIGPFTVNVGLLICEDGAVSFQVDTTRYALNSEAEQLSRKDSVSHLGQWEDLDSIRSVDANGAPMSLNAVVERGAAACDSDS